MWLEGYKEEVKHDRYVKLSTKRYIILYDKSEVDKVIKSRGNIILYTRVK